MALKPTIYKFRIAVSDMDKDLYPSFNLTVAQHPSETLERMMARVMVMCLHADIPLLMSKGLSTQDEPDLWYKSLDEQILTWVEVGEPDPERIKKACRRAKQVMVYSFNTKSDVWWRQSQAKLAVLPVSVYRFDWQQIVELTTLISRSTELSLTVCDQTLFVAAPQGNCELNVVALN